jgi:outer membrane protein assembly factor BamB
VLALLVGGLVLAGCSDENAPLPGERFALRPAEAAALTASNARPISLGPAQVNASWTHRNGSASGRPGHPALAPVPQLRWSVGIGAGDDKRRRIVTNPIVAGGLIFAMDAEGRLTAVTRSGQVAWSRSLVPASEVPDAGPGGGLAFAGGVLFVTTGFGEVLALDPATGGTFWSVQFEAPIRAAPAIANGQVIVVLRNDAAYALQASDGAVLWRVSGGGGTGLLGGAVPAVDGPLVVVPFASGEVLGVLSRNGLTLWGTALTGGRRELVRNQIYDITGDPVIDGQVIYASNQSGRTIRLDRTTGEREWTMPEGSYGPVWPVGGSIFLLSDTGTLVRAEAATGEIIWATQLPEYYVNRGIFRERPPVSAVTHYGPVLAGGRLWVASGDGLLRAFSPVNGALLAEIGVPGGAAAAPAVAGGAMYVVGRDGRLYAFQ